MEKDIDDMQAPRTAMLYSDTQYIEYIAAQRARVHRAAAALGNIQAERQMSTQADKQIEEITGGCSGNAGNLKEGSSGGVGAKNTQARR